MTDEIDRIVREYQVELIEDKPLKGMWHCGPNAAWVEVTHLPTMISARAFDQSHHHARQAAMACCEMMVAQSRLPKCQFPERLAVRNRLQENSRGD
jgi:hypothetical protein